MTRRNSGGNDATRCGGKHDGKRCNKLLENVKNRLLVASANELQLKSRCNEDGYPREIDCAWRKKYEDVENLQRWLSKDDV